MLHQPGRVDEECYAIPGLTILERGVPQLPHMPSRNPQSMFYKADQVLYSEPPLFFYLQALVYAIVPVSCASSRVVSIVSGGLTIFIAATLAFRWTGKPLAAYFTAACLGLTKWFYYGIILARPDMLCTFFGLAAVLLTDNWVRTGKTKWLLGSGAIIGLAGLTLPLALAIAVQIAFWIFLQSSGLRRWINPGLVAVVSLAVFSLWIPQIAIDPETFRIQFHNQFFENQLLIMDDVQPPNRFELVCMSLWSNARALLMYKGVYQFVLVVVPLVVVPIWAALTGNLIQARAAWLSWSAFIILSLLVGRAHHPGYWAYLGTLACMNLSIFFVLATDWLSARWGHKGHILAMTLGIGIVASLIPGSGARLFSVYLRHWYHPNYQVDRFAQQVLAEIPEGATCLVDRELVLNFIAAGRNTLALPVFPIFFDPTGYHYDYAIVGRTGLEVNVTENFQGTFVKSLGIETDEFACFVKIYRRL